MGRWISASLCDVIAGVAAAADPDTREAYAYVRRINGAAGRIAASPLRGTFREGMRVTIHDKGGTAVCEGTATSVYDDLVYVDVPGIDLSRIEKGFLVAANGKPETMAALREDPAIAKGLQADTVLYCGMRGKTIENFRSAGTMTPVTFDARAPYHSGACGTCHHESEDSWANCAACHGEDKNGNVPGLKDAFHTRCEGCHRGTGVASSGCYDCHLPHVARRDSTSRLKRWGSSVPDGLVIRAIRKNKPPVRFRHKDHVARSREHCNDCHHKDEAGKERRCYAPNCHGARAEGRKVALKDAFHKVCRDCHFKARRDKLHGAPTKCHECHPK